MSVLDKLNQKVDELIFSLNELSNEVERLKKENNDLTNIIQDKDSKINQLYEELSLADRSYEVIINKINEATNR